MASFVKKSLMSCKDDLVVSKECGKLRVLDILGRPILKKMLLLVLVYIEAASSNYTTTKSCYQGCGIDQSPTGSVDDQNAFFQFLENIHIDRMLGLRQERH